MKCSFCGHENKDQAKFCGSCGRDLSLPDIQETPSQKEAKKINGKVVLIGLLVLFILAGFGFYALSKSKQNKEVNELLQKLEVQEMNKDYSAMLETNQDLYNLTKDDQYKKKMEAIKGQKANDDLYAQAEEILAKDNMKKEDFIQAYEIILNLEKNKVKDPAEVEKLKASFLGILNDLVKTNNELGFFDESREILQGLLSLDPKNEFFNNNLQGVQEENKIQEAQMEENAKIERLEDLGRDLLEKKIKTTTSKANIRSGPSTNYPILFSVGPGTECYVKDFSVDDTGLLWLYVGDAGWVTHNNFQ